MFIELVESLRCIRPHEQTWLVAAVREMDGRHIRTGTLGCPVCAAEYPIERGVAYFAERPAGAGDASGAAVPDESPVPGSDGDALAMRGAALLALAEQGGAIALGGAWVRAAEGILALSEGMQILAINPPADVEGGAGISPLRIGGALPLAPGALRGIALDRATRDLIPTEAAVAALRPRGRLLLPVDTPLPAGVTELARDAHEWVAERAEATSRPVGLRRGGSRT